MKSTRVLVAISTLAVTSFLSGCGSLAVTAANSLGAPPAVSAVAEQVNGVAPNRKQEVQFSEAMDASTINAQTFTVTDPAGNAVRGDVTYDAAYDIASFQPNPSLQTGATYNATISAEVASVGGAHLAKHYTFTFSTRATTDTSPIAINSVSPAAGATCVSATSPITITFSEAPDAATVNATNILVSGPNGVIPVSFSLNASTTQAVLTPNSPLPAGTISVAVQNVADLADVRMSAPYTWSFSTSCSSTEPPPTGTTAQYQAPLFGKNAMSGQVTVDAAGMVTAQLKAAPPNRALTLGFCPLIPIGQTTSGCFSLGTINTYASGDGSLTVKFPKSGAWAGDFELAAGSLNPSGFAADYGTTYGPGYFSTLQAAKSINGGSLNSGTGNLPQAQLASGTVTYSSSHAPYGSFQFSLTGAPANTTFQSVEGNLFLGGSSNYALYNSQSQGNFTSDAQGNLTFTVLQDGTAGDILFVEPVENSSGKLIMQGYIGGFSVP